MPQCDVSNTNLQASSRPPAKERTLHASRLQDKDERKPPAASSRAVCASRSRRQGNSTRNQIYQIPGYVRPHSTAAASGRSRRWEFVTGSFFRNDKRPHRRCRCSCRCDGSTPIFGGKEELAKPKAPLLSNSREASLPTGGSILGFRGVGVHPRRPPFQRAELYWCLHTRVRCTSTARPAGVGAQAGDRRATVLPSHHTPSEESSDDKAGAYRSRGKTVNSCRPTVEMQCKYAVSTNLSGTTGQRAANQPSTAATAPAVAATVAASRGDRDRHGNTRAYTM